MKSYETADAITDGANSIPRPIVIPNAVIGTIGTLLINIAKLRVESVKDSNNKSFRRTKRSK